MHSHGTVLKHTTLRQMRFFVVLHDVIKFSPDHMAGNTFQPITQLYNLKLFSVYSCRKKIIPGKWNWFVLCSLSFASQWAVCHSEAVPRKEHWPRFCRQVHQKAPELDQLSGGAAGGDWAGGGDPAADPTPQHCHASWCLREPHRCGAHPGAVSRLRLSGAAAAAFKARQYIAVTGSLGVSCLISWRRRSRWARRRPLSSLSRSWRVSTTSTPEKLPTLTSRLVHHSVQKATALLWHVHKPELGSWAVEQKSRIDIPRAWWI